jgi:hypothetical protein
MPLKSGVVFQGISSDHQINRPKLNDLILGTGGGQCRILASTWLSQEGSAPLRFHHHLAGTFKKA